MNGWALCVTSRERSSSQVIIVECLLLLLRKGFVSGTQRHDTVRDALDSRIWFRFVVRLVSLAAATGVTYGFQIER